jgi:hypothetical protein
MELTAEYAAPPARHSVLLYSSKDEFVSWLAPFVSEGIEEGDAVIAVAEEANLAALREALGEVPPSVRFVDGAAWYATGPDTMARWLAFAEGQRAAGRPRVRIIGEVVWPDDSTLHWEMKRFEASSTVAFTPRNDLVVCPYNTERLPDSIIQHALETHPGVVSGGRASLNDKFIEPERMVREFLPKLHAPSDGEHARFEPFDVTSAAEFVERHARRGGLDELRVQNVVSAASELAMNAFIHVGSSVHVTTWTDDGQFRCQIEDEGGGVADPGAGYYPPMGVDERWGIWLARTRSDGLEFGTGLRGSAARLTMQRGATGAPTVMSRL